MTAFRDSARIFRIADIMGYIEVFCNFSGSVWSTAAAEPGFLHRQWLHSTVLHASGN